MMNRVRLGIDNVIGNNGPLFSTNIFVLVNSTHSEVNILCLDIAYDDI